MNLGLQPVPAPHGEILRIAAGAGDGVRIDRDGPVVIQALDDTEIAIERPAPGQARLARIGRGCRTAAALLLSAARAFVEPARRWRFAAGARPARPH
jgi:hypothetical protein